MRIISLHANGACGMDPSVTSNPASYFIFLQFILVVESSVTIVESSHAILIFFLQTENPRLEVKISLILVLPGLEYI